MAVTDDDELRRLLDCETVAILGCSSTSGKAAHTTPRYVDEQGYDVVPINPHADEIFGREAHDELGDVDAEIDLVDVFRPSEEVPGVVDDVIARHEARGDADALWLQLGIRHDEAAERATDAGIDVVQDRCIKIEHRRLVR